MVGGTVRDSVTTDARVMWTSVCSHEGSSGRGVRIIKRVGAAAINPDLGEE